MTAASLIIVALTSLAPAEDKTVEFVGFSRDETVAAWRLEVRRPRDDGRSIDTFTLIRLVKSIDNTPLVDFRASSVRRTNDKGRVLHVNSATLEADNPDWARAESPPLGNAPDRAVILPPRS